MQLKTFICRGNSIAKLYKQFSPHLCLLFYKFYLLLISYAWRQALGINPANGKTFAFANTETAVTSTDSTSYSHKFWITKATTKHNTKAQRLISDTSLYTDVKWVKQYVIGNLWCKTWSNRLNNLYSSKWNKLFLLTMKQEQGATTADCKLANRRVNKVNSAMTCFKNYLVVLKSF